MRPRAPTQWFDPTKNGDVVQPRWSELKKRLYSAPTSSHITSTPPQAQRPPPETPAKRPRGRPRKHPEPTVDHHDARSTQAATPKSQSLAKSQAQTQTPAHANAALTTLQGQVSTGNSSQMRVKAFAIPADDTCCF